MATNDPTPKRQKRSHDELDAAPLPVPEAPPPKFGANQVFDFNFNTTVSPRALPVQGARPVGYAAMATGAWDRIMRQERVARDHHPIIHNHMYAAPAPQADTSSVLIGFLWFFVYLSLAVIFLCLSLLCIHTFWRDVEERISRQRLDIVQDIAMCAMHYKNNRCATDAVPAMAHQCASWETCLNQATTVGRLKVGAELISETVSSFVEPITGKALAFFLVLALIVFKKGFF